MSIKPTKPRGHAANIKHLKNNQDVVYKGLLGFYKIQVFYNPGVFFPLHFLTGTCSMCMFFKDFLATQISWCYKWRRNEKEFFNSQFI